MRYIKLSTIIIFTIVIVLVCGCTNIDSYVPLNDYNNKVVELEEANNTIGIRDGTITDLEEEKSNLETDLNLTEEELIKYKNLLNNLNSLLSNVYYGYAKNENWKSEGFTAFSLNYRGKIFLITAGHCIHYNFEGLDTGLYTTIKFKQNNGNWIYPRLLAYENDYYRDYAILYSDKIESGLVYDLKNSYPKFTLGNMNDNVLKEFSNLNLIEGECGSPVVDIDGEVTEIATGNYTDIDLVIEAIDNLE